MALSNNQRLKLNSGSPIDQQVQLGDAVYSAPVLLFASIEADATGGLSITVPFALEVVQVIAQCRTANGSGTATLRNVTTAVTDAIVMAVDKTNIEATTIDDAQSTFAAGGNMNVVTNGAADRGLVTVVCRRL